jgi:hypothetical protein
MTREAAPMNGAIVNMKIKEAIELVTEKKYKKILTQHRERHVDSEITVTDKGDVFETIVTHPPTEDETGGAEQYFIDKKTGETTMGWHEHPMELPETIDGNGDVDEKPDAGKE